MTIIEKIGQKIQLFLKFLCSPVSRDLERDIWQIISKLVAFHEKTISKARTFSSFALEGGGAHVSDYPV